MNRTIRTWVEISLNNLEHNYHEICSRLPEGCHFTLWKDCLTRGGGPELTARLVQLLLEKRQLRGSTGVVVVDEGAIAFYPEGAQSASVQRPLIYQKQP